MRGKASIVGACGEETFGEGSLDAGGVTVVAMPDGGASDAPLSGSAIKSPKA